MLWRNASYVICLQLLENVYCLNFVLLFIVDVPCWQFKISVMITYNIYIVIRETGQFSSKGIINDFIGNLNRLTVSRRFTEQAV